MLTPAGVEYLRRISPLVVAIIIPKIYLQKGIETYFSACITLGLSKKKNKEEAGGIESSHFSSKRFRSVTNHGQAFEFENLRN